MKALISGLILICYASLVQAQEQRLLRVDVRQNLLTQKIDVLDGPRMLSVPEVKTLMQNDPEALSLYEKSRNKHRVDVILSILDLGLMAGTTVLAFAPQQQSSQVSNLFWPSVIATAAVTITAGFFRREARNLSREAIDLYNFGTPDGSPVYFQDNTRIDQPIFSFRIPLR